MLLPMMFLWLSLECDPLDIKYPSIIYRDVYFLYPDPFEDIYYLLDSDDVYIMCEDCWD